MPGCPRCNEDVDRADDFCTSCGTALRIRGARPGDVVLVIDRGLYQFGKFVLAIVAILMVVGGFVVGFDLKELVNEMGERRVEIATASEQVSEATRRTGKAVAELDGRVAVATTRIEKSTKEMDARLAEANRQVADLRKSVEEAKTALAAIHRARGEAEVFVSNLLSLNTEELVRAEKVAIAGIDGDVGEGIDVSADPTGAEEAPNRERLFPPGSELTFAFLDDPSEAERNAVLQALAVWQPYVNLKFTEVDNAADATIRIGFREGNGSWSFLGRDALQVGPNDPTMNFGWDITQPGQENTVLSEVGHALGFPNEHQNPRKGIEWNRDAVFDHFSKPPLNWSASQVTFNILRKLEFRNYPCTRDYDPNSVMMYSFPAGLTKSGEAITPEPGLSESDKACAREMYPSG